MHGQEGMPFSIFAMLDSVMTRPSAVRCGKPRPVVFDTRRVGARNALPGTCIDCPASRCLFPHRSWNSGSPSSKNLLYFMQYCISRTPRSNTSPQSTANQAECRERPA